MYPNFSVSAPVPRYPHQQALPTGGNYHPQEACPISNYHPQQALTMGNYTHQEAGLISNYHTQQMDTYYPQQDVAMSRYPPQQSVSMPTYPPHHSASMPTYPPQQVMGMIPSSFAQQEDLASLRCPRYAFQLMTGMLEVLSEPYLQDITLVCSDGRSVRSNKLLLAACSPYFRQVLAMQNNEVYLPGITFEVLNVLLVFMFRGNVDVSQLLLPYVMQAANSLQIRGFQEAWSALPQAITGETQCPVDNCKPQVACPQPAKKRKLEIEDHVSDEDTTSSSCLFRPWKAFAAGSVSSKETDTDERPPRLFTPLSPTEPLDTTTSFHIPPLATSLLPLDIPAPADTPRIATSTPYVTAQQPSRVSPNTSIDFSPLLASTMKTPRPCATPVASMRGNAHPVDCTPTSPTNWYSALGSTTDFTTPLAGALKKLTSKAFTKKCTMSTTSLMSRLNSREYNSSDTMDQYATPVACLSKPGNMASPPPVPQYKTQSQPMDPIKASPSSTPEVLTDPLSLFDESKDDTVVEYRDETDDESHLVIALDEQHDQEL